MVSVAESSQPTREFFGLVQKLVSTQEPTAVSILFPILAVRFEEKRSISGFLVALRLDDLDEERFRSVLCRSKNLQLNKNRRPLRNFGAAFSIAPARSAVRCRSPA